MYKSAEMHFSGPNNNQVCTRKGAFGNPKGAQNEKKTGERTVLFFRVENKVGGSVCEALHEPTPVPPPTMLHL